MTRCFGFKIQLHDQVEVPQMKDQGFAVAPGTHTLVGVKRLEVQIEHKICGQATI